MTHAEIEKFLLAHDPIGLVDDAMTTPSRRAALIEAVAALVEHVIDETIAHCDNCNDLEDRWQRAVGMPLEQAERLAECERNATP